MHRVLILGAGLVSRPVVRYFLEREDCQLVVASLARSEAELAVGDHPRGTAQEVDVSDPTQLAPLVRSSDLVISLVPYAFHVGVARLAVEHRTDMVTTSYVSPEMRAIDADARRAGITILNEVGLDPGIDHMSAMRMIDRVRQTGGSVVEFLSACGALPAPEAADNPWRYKFSWSPHGVLRAARLPARHLERGRVVEVPADELFRHRRPALVEGVGPLESYPNRDSLPYVESYGLHGVETMLRATLRHPGWCETMDALVRLGLLDEAARSWPPGATYADLLGAALPPGTGAIEERLARRLGLERGDPVLERLAWAGLPSSTPLGRARASPLDLLAEILASRMAYAGEERDMVVLRHEILARWPGRRSDERRISQLVAYREPGSDTATARTVSLPAAVAGRLLLEGRLGAGGVRIPTAREIYEPILDALEGLGIAFREWSEPPGPGFASAPPST